MSKSILYSKRIEALQQVSISATTVIIVSLILLLAKENNLSRSLFMGGIVWLVPNFYFAYKVFAGNKAKITPGLMLKNFYRAEVIKLTLCAILFIAIVKYFPVAVIPLLIGYSIAQVTFWFSPLLLDKMKRLAK